MVNGKWQARVVAGHGGHVGLMDIPLAVYY